MCVDSGGELGEHERQQERADAQQEQACCAAACGRGWGRSRRLKRGGEGVGTKGAACKHEQVLRRATLRAATGNVRRSR